MNQIFFFTGKENIFFFIKKKEASPFIKEKKGQFGIDIAYRLDKDVIERMSLSGIGYKAKGNRNNISLKTEQTVKFFNTNPYFETKSKGEFDDRS
jgi:hypothetical protein